MGEVTVRVKLTNVIDVERAAAGEAVTPRSVEVDAIVDTGAMRSFIPEGIAVALGLHLVGGLGLPGGPRRAWGLQFELVGRDTSEEALVLGDRVVLGRTTLAATALVVDNLSNTVVRDPANPDGVMWVRGARRG